MKNRIVIGDIHGHWDNLNEIYNTEHPDEVILLGDYCDSFNIESSDIFKCWNNIIKLKYAHEQNNGIFCLLMGNHDWHYISHTEKYSGYNVKTYNIMHDVLSEAYKTKVLHIAYIDNINKTIYSHAGITNTWLADWNNPPLDMLDDVNSKALNFSNKTFDMYGNSIYQGPLWVRPQALVSDMYIDEDNYKWTQIVGHTHLRNNNPILIDNDMRIVSDDNIDKESIELNVNNIKHDDIKLWVIDCMPFYYIKETLDDNGVLVDRKLINFRKANDKYMQ